MMAFCEEENIKLKESKFVISQVLEFGGCRISREILGEKETTLVSRNGG